MTEYRIRVDHVNAFDMLDLDRYLSKYATAYLLVRHEPKQTDVHYHIWMSSKHAEVTVRMMLTKHLPYLKGNGGHSISACDPTRRDEYLQYLFNRKHGNLASYVKDVGLGNWADFQKKANEATVEYIKNKKGTYSKNDCIEELIALEREWNEDELYDAVMAATRRHKTVFSINAIRDVIIATAYHSGTQQTKATVREAVMKVFHPFTPGK